MVFEVYTARCPDMKIQIVHMKNVASNHPFGIYLFGGITMSTDFKHLFNEGTMLLILTHFDV